MKGVRFYRDANGEAIDLGMHRKTTPSWNGLAIFPDERMPDGAFAAIASLVNDPGDGPYCTTSVSYDYLRKQCMRVSEATARQLFPNLIKDLED